MRHFFEVLKIRHILMVTFLILSLIPLIFLTTIVYIYTKNIVITTMTNNLEAIADRQGEQIRDYFRQKEREVRVLAKSPYIQQIIQNVSNVVQKHDLDSPEYFEAIAPLEKFLAFYLKEGSYDDLFFISEDGTAIFSVKRGEDLGSNYRTGIYQDTELAKVFDRASTLLETQISDFAYYPATNEPAIFIAAPILEDKVLGTIVLQLNNKDIYNVVNNYTGLQTTGETLIIGQMGDRMTYLTPTRFDPLATYKRQILLDDVDGAFFSNVIRGKEMKGILKDYRGKETLAVGKYFLPELGWGMIVKIDTDEIFAPISRIKWMATFVVLFTALTVFLVAYRVARYLTNPIIYLMQKANLVAEGNLHEPIKVNAKNEIGKLAFSLNEMKQKLKNIIEHLDDLVKERTKELLNAQDRLIIQEKLASLGALTAGIAHEIKNPLNFVNNFSSLSLDIVNELKQKIEGHTNLITEEEEQFLTLKENIKSVVEQGKKADSIIQRMLAHSRSGKGTYTLTNINQLLGEYLDLSFHSVTLENIPSNITIEKKLDQSLEKINIIAEDIGRVLLNIFSNAFYTMSQKNKITSHYLPVLFIETKNNAPMIEIRIKDNGMGMPEEIAKKVFTPFFTTKPPGDGTGLGLSLSYNIIVHEHQGKLEFHTEEGKYTEFIISLPATNQIKSIATES